MGTALRAFAHPRRARGLTDDGQDGKEDRSPRRRGAGEVAQRFRDARLNDLGEFHPVCSVPCHNRWKYLPATTASSGSRQATSIEYRSTSCWIFLFCARFVYRTACICAPSGVAVSANCCLL